MNRKFDLQRLKHSFVGMAGLSMIGIPLMLMANIILARTLSVAEFGTFGFVIALATVLAIPVAGGLPMLLTREVAAYSQNKDWAAYRGLVVATYGWVAVMCGLIALGLSGSWLMARDLPAGPLLVTVLLVPFLGLNGVRAGILKGLGRPVMAEAPPQLLQPPLMILGYLGLAWLGLSSAMSVLWWYLGVVIAVFGLASLLLWRVQPAQVHHVASDLTDLSRWRRAILPFVLISAASVLSTQVAVLLLGFSGQEEAVALMRVAERGALLVAMPLSFINTILGPYFVQAMKSEEDGAMRRIVRQSARLTLAASLPVALLLLLFGDTLIGWTFGAPYGAMSYRQAVMPNPAGIRYEDFSEDLDLWCRMSDLGAEGRYFLTLPENLLRYRKPLDSLSTKNLSLMQLKMRWIKDCLRRRRAGQPERTLANFIASRTAWQRFSDWRSDNAAGFYKRAGFAYARRNFPALAWYLALASALSPKLIRQKIASQKAAL